MQTHMHSFNRVCMFVRLQMFAIVHLRDLVRNRIDTQATSFFTLWGAGRINRAPKTVSYCVNFIRAFKIVYTQNTNVLCAITLNRFSCDCNRLCVFVRL